MRLDRISCLYALFSWSRYLTLVPLSSNWWFIIIVSGFKIKPALPYRQNLKKVQTYPPPKLSQNIHPGKWNAAGPQQQTKDKRLPGMLTFKVGLPCRLRFSWLHDKSVHRLLHPIYCRLVLFDSVWQRSVWHAQSLLAGRTISIRYRIGLRAHCTLGPP